MRPPSGDQEATNSRELGSEFVRRTGGPPDSEEIQMKTSPPAPPLVYAMRSPFGDNEVFANLFVVPAGNIECVTSGRSEPSGSRSQISSTPLRAVT